MMGVREALAERVRRYERMLETHSDDEAAPRWREHLEAERAAIRKIDKEDRA
jgi:hypothetical protein